MSIIFTKLFFSDVETHELYIEDPNGENSPPMFGGLCCRMAAVPYCCEDPVFDGMVVMNGTPSLSNKLVFASLMDWRLSLWNNRDQKEAARRPLLQIPINRDTCVLESEDSVISITNETNTWTLDPERSEDKSRWLMALLQHAADHRRWKIAASQKLPLGASSEVDLAENGQQSRKRPRYTKSFKRTRSKLFMLYNQAGVEDELI